MKKIIVFSCLLLVAFTAAASISVGTAPTSLVTSATTLAASADKAIFEFALTADAAETLSSVALTVNSATASSSDLAGLKVYMDDGDSSYDAGDMLAGTNSSVNIGSATTVTTGSNNTLTGAKFFVVLSTGASWAGTDSVTVSFNADGITTSSNSPTNSLVTTSTISAPEVVDSTGPALTSVVAKNTGGTTAKEAGDSVELIFGEATNKPVITAANIATTLVLNNSHSWLDGAGVLGTAVWDSTGTKLTITLTAGTSVPTIAVGDTVTVSGALIKDAANNDAAGTKTITGSFEAKLSDDEDDDDDDDFGKKCGSIVNGKLYKVAGSDTIYLAAGCRLKPFRGAAVFHARGHKFQNIITLPSLTDLEVSTKPALPAGGTLIKGSAPTVWFVTESGKIKGFSSEKSFKRLGFNFGSVKPISDSDLQEMSQDTVINDDSAHPEGAVVKCQTTSTVYMMKGNKKYAFTNPMPYLERGHTWDAIAVIDCQSFTYPEGTNITQ